MSRKSARKKKRTGTGPRAGASRPVLQPEGFWARLRARLPFGRARRAPDRRAVLEARPVRNERIEWELRPDERSGAPVAVLRIPRRRDRWGRLLERLFDAPECRRVVLDELGTDVWQMCDGNTTLEALIRTLARKHRLERREVEVSLTAYLKTLARRGYIGLRMGGSEGEERP